SIACGALFPCTAWFWGHQEHINQLAATAWMPWAVFLWWMWLGKRLATPTFLITITMLSAWQFLTGHPQEAVYSQLLCLALVLGWVAVAGDRKSEIYRLLPVGIAMGVVAGLLVALQLLPTLELSSHSRRQFPDPAYPLWSSMPPDLFITYLSPHWFGSFLDGWFVRGPDGAVLADPQGNPVWDRRGYGEYGLYIGVPALLLAIVGAVTTRRRLVAWLGIITILAWLLALGGNTDPGRILSGNFTEFPQPGWSLHELFITIFPPAAGFRVPARIVILATFSLVTLAAFGYTWVISRTGTEARTKIAVAIGILLLVAVYIPSRKEKYHHPVDIRPALEYNRGVAREFNTLDNRIFRMTMADDGRLVAERHHETTFQTPNPILTRMASMQPHMNIIQGVAIVDGYEEGLAPTARYKDFIYEFNRNLRQFHPDAHFLALLGVSHVYTDLPIDTDAYPMDFSLSLPHRLIHRNQQARGAAFWRQATEGIDLARLDGPFWRGGNPNPEIRREAVDYGTPIDWNPSPNHPALATTVESPNRVVVHYEADQRHDAEALLAMGWFPGWVIDGEPVEWVSAVHAQLPTDRQSALDDGRHGWVLAYRPFSWKAGLYLTALGLFLWGGLLGHRLSPANRRSP
ncbi:MAG: hypothetical protein JJU11_15385, partial [Candidatus Sumerlaeia bacterium]|nr:hypothetical protein [Candidatus Sumerlaeia bacterium]